MSPRAGLSPSRRVFMDPFGGGSKDPTFPNARKPFHKDVVVSGSLLLLNSVASSRRMLFAGSGTKRRGQLVDAVARKVNVLVGRQALAVVTELLGAVDERRLHPEMGHGFEFPRMGGNHQHAR